MMRFAALAAVVALASGSCPNQCSGHGRCGEFDKCTCYKQTGLASPYKYAYTGVDCSMRTCPLGRAYDDISTATSTLTPITFTAAQPNSRSKLRAYYSPPNRSSMFTDKYRRDQKFIVKVMSVDSNGVGTFTWKLEEDEYFQPETKIIDSSSEQSARHLGKPANNLATGVYVWWDFTYRGTESSEEIFAGDIYTLSLTYNEGIDFFEGDSNTVHQEIECSGRGTCDYAAGKCKCLDGYTGEACQRTVCQNACSGHGACQAEARFVSDARVEGGKYEDAYDAQQQYGCKCDAGYRGADCAQIECPSGADPMGGDGGAQGRDCSGRGTCDYSTGICKCFKGFYGERCESQTNFV